ncbi:hypothetical protein [Nitrospirillum amazonense]|uniref:Uncharacterized protein n=1 Tax=Nitrospirillum amazonense TaxID=28077 RepID=A0A560K3A1_9PROT|nr:hypothetical protein [Nitrospirillum amazonense]MDG3444254.1 hypothetical protein [Nitrospirillum amazonense]TWB77808.1 hypothetical protein FBZ87_103627 [Nitrospirillum amazonense]
MAPNAPALRVLLALAGTCCTGPGGGALLLAQVDWLMPRLRTWASGNGQGGRKKDGMPLITGGDFGQTPAFPSSPPR